MFYTSNVIYASHGGALAAAAQQMAQEGGWELVQCIPPNIVATPNIHQQAGSMTHLPFPTGEWTCIFRRLLNGA